MTDPELQGLALQALNIAKRDFEQRGRGWMIGVYHRDEGLHRLTKIEDFIIQTLGERWLDSGAKKDMAFSILRTGVDAMPPDAVVFVTAANMFEPTAKFMALPPEEQMRIANQGNDKHHIHAKQGYFRIVDCFNAVAQTPERVCYYTQSVEDGKFVGQPRVMIAGQSTFSGRLKMYGYTEKEVQ